MDYLKEFPSLERFEELSHILIDESLYYPLQKVGILPKLSSFEKLRSFFESTLPLNQRIRRACEKSGIIFSLFARYVSIRRDIFPESLCKELSHTKIHPQVPPSISEFKKEILAIQPKLKGISRISYVSTKDFLHTFEVVHKKKKYFVQYMRPQTRKNIMVDIDSLLAFAQILDDSYMHIVNQPIKLVAHEFVLHIYHVLNFQSEKMKYSKIHSLFTKSDGIHPINISRLTTPYVFVFAAAQTQNLVSAFTNQQVTDTIVQRLSTFFFKPLFEKHILVHPLEFEDVWITHKNEITLLGSISYSSISKEQVSHLGKIIESILHPNYHDCVKYFLLAHSHTYVSKAALEDIIRDVKQYFESKISTVSLATAFLDLISLYRKYKIPIPEVYVFFSHHLHFIEKAISLSGTRTDLTELIQAHLLTTVEKEVKSHITKFGDLKHIEHVQHKEKDSQLLQKKVLSAELTVEKLERLTKKVLYTLLVCTFLLITTLFVLFGQNVPTIIVLPVFILGCMLIFFLIYETYAK